MNEPATIAKDKEACLMSRLDHSGEYGENTPVRKKKKGSKGLYYVILLVLIGVLVFSCVKIISYFKKDHEQSAISDDIFNEFITTDPSSGETSTAPSGETASSGETQTIEPQPDKISVNFTDMIAKYPDVVGYIYCANTRNTKGQYGINYPILYTTEMVDYKGVREDKYLHHAIDGSENANGAIFIEELCNPDFSSQNTIIYGHNMKTGAMFQPLEFYKNQYYYDAHPYMYIYTPTQNYRLDLFAGCVVEHNADIYATSVSQATLQNYVNNSTFKSKTGVPTGNIVTLSTCSYEINNGRYVVLGELVPID